MGVWFSVSLAGPCTGGGEACLGKIMTLFLGVFLISLAGLICAGFSLFGREKRSLIAAIGLVGNVVPTGCWIWWIVVENPVTKVFK